MMRAYNSKLIPIIHHLSDKYYIKDLESLSPVKFYNDKEIRKIIRKYRTNDNEELPLDLIYSFGKYIVSIAKNYQEQGLSLGDLISEGILGLLQAIKKYDVDNPTKFVTYSNTVISRYMREALDYSNNIVKLPKNIRNKRMKVREIINLMRMQGKSETEIINMIDEQGEIFYLAPDIYTRKSIDDTIRYDFDADVYDLLENQEEILKFKDLEKDINHILDTKLTKDEKNVISCTFGIKLLYPITSIRDISKHLNLSKTMVKNLRDSANQKLKNEDCIEILSKYI